MRKQALTLLSALALAASALAQTKAPEVTATANTEKLWKIETTGLGG